MAIHQQCMRAIVCSRAHSELRGNLPNRPKTGDSLFGPGDRNAGAILGVFEGNGLYEYATAYRLARVPLSRDSTDLRFVSGYRYQLYFPLRYQPTVVYFPALQTSPQNPDPCFISRTRPAARYGTE